MILLLIEQHPMPYIPIMFENDSGLIHIPTVNDVGPFDIMGLIMKSAPLAGVEKFAERPSELKALEEAGAVTFGAPPQTLRLVVLLHTVPFVLVFKLSLVTVPAGMAPDGRSSNFQ